MDYEDRTTLDRLVEQVEAAGRARQLWTLALTATTRMRKSAPAERRGEAGRLLGIIEALSIITNESPKQVALDLGAVSELAEEQFIL